VCAVYLYEFKAGLYGPASGLSEVAHNSLNAVNGEGFHFPTNRGAGQVGRGEGFLFDHPCRGLPTAMVNLDGGHSALRLNHVHDARETLYGPVVIDSCLMVRHDALR